MQINNINEILNESDVWVEHNELVPCGLWGNMVVVHFTNLITREDIEFDAKGREEDIVNFRKIHSIVSSDLAKEYIQKREERKSQKKRGQMPSLFSRLKVDSLVPQDGLENIADALLHLPHRKRTFGDVGG